MTGLYSTHCIEYKDVKSNYNVMWNFITADTDNFLDFAHKSTGFPTWHRLFLLWLEREIQIMTDNHTFRLPYWDWRDPLQRDVLFQRDRLGENVDGNVEGVLFDDDMWQTRCWEDIEPDPPLPLPICDPVQPSGENLRRCPNATLCDKNNENWPSYEDIATAIAIDSYDTSPYDRFVEDTDNSYRNYMEGFITKPGEDCGDDTMCSFDDKRNVTVSRKIHNTVSLSLYLILCTHYTPAVHNRWLYIDFSHFDVHSTITTTLVTVFTYPCVYIYPLPQFSACIISMLYTILCEICVGSRSALASYSHVYKYYVGSYNTGNW